MSKVRLPGSLPRFTPEAHLLGSLPGIIFDLHLPALPLKLILAVRELSGNGPGSCPFEVEALREGVESRSFVGHHGRFSGSLAGNHQFHDQLL